MVVDAARKCCVGQGAGGRAGGRCVQAEQTGGQWMRNGWEGELGRRIKIMAGAPGGGV